MAEGNNLRRSKSLKGTLSRRFGRREEQTESVPIPFR
jgi:hypothetical protein